jgi:hypothetical protein
MRRSYAVRVETPPVSDGHVQSVIRDVRWSIGVCDGLVDRTSAWVVEASADRSVREAPRSTCRPLTRLQGVIISHHDEISTSDP